MATKKIVLSTTLDLVSGATKEIELDFDKIKGRDIVAAENVARQAGDMLPMLTFSSNYHAALAAQVLGAKYDDILDLPGSDFNKISNAVLSFLTGQA